MRALTSTSATVAPVLTGVRYQRPGTRSPADSVNVWLAPATADTRTPGALRGGAGAITGPAGVSTRDAYSATLPWSPRVRKLTVPAPGGTSKYRRSCAAPGG